MATVFEPIRPVPPTTTIFMGHPVVDDSKLQPWRKISVDYRADVNTEAVGLVQLNFATLGEMPFPRRECIDRASPARRRGHADAGIGEPCLGGLDVVPTETRRLVLGSDHNGGMSRHSDLMIARARLQWLGEVRQMSATVEGFG